ncbi:MAG: hypothetical protein RQ824_11105 [bacterium]|nr:hypothetical protein [bacterium]
MTYFILTMAFLAILTLQLYNIIKLRNIVTEYNEKVERLRGIVDNQEAETRTLLKAYLTESEVTKFYDDASLIVKDRDVVRLFSRLARDEKKHIALLDHCLSEKGVQ